MKNKSEAKPTATFPYKGRQKVSKNGAGLLHQHFTETSPGFRAFSLETFRQRCGKVSVVLSTFYLLPHIAEYMRKLLIQFDITSSYLYVVVLKDL